MINPITVVHNKTSRKELQDRIKKALENKPTALSLNRPNQIAITQPRGAVKTIKKNQNKRPIQEGRPSQATFTTGQAYLIDQEVKRRNLSHFQPMKPFVTQSTFKHSGDLGDLWYSLPIIRYMGGGSIHLAHDALKSIKADGTPSGLSNSMIEMATPLLESQPYIKKCSIWNDEKPDLDMDIFRRINLYGDINLCELILMNSGCPFSEAETPWITADSKRIAARVFARSPRYHNPNVNYKEIYDAYKTDAVFVGLPSEHKDFVNKIGPIEYHPVKNFLEMAETIEGADLFIGNQSSPMAIAIGLGKAFIQEVCPNCPNCMFNRPNAKYLT